MAESKLHGYLTVLGAMMVITTGTSYTHGNFGPYLTSYIRVYSSPSSISNVYITWLSASHVLSQGLGMLISSPIHGKIRSRWTAALGSLLMSFGVLVSFYSVDSSFYALLVTYTVLVGLGFGIVYVPMMSCAMVWFPRYQGLVNGIVLGGLGAGGFIFNQIMTAFINPENKSPDLPREPGSSEMYFSPYKAYDVLSRVPYWFLLCGACFALLQIIGCFIIRERKFDPIKPKKKSTEKSPLLDDSQVHVHIDKLESLEYSFAPDMTPTEMLKTRSFYIFWIIIFCGGQTAFFIGALYKAYGQTFIQDDRLLALLGSFSAICNTVGRLFWGYLADRFSIKIALLCMFATSIFLTSTLNLTPYGGKPMYFIWICAIYFTFAGLYCIFPTATAKAYGQKHVVINYGILFCAMCISGVIGPLLATFLTYTIGWNGMFFLITGFSCVGFAFGFAINVKTKDGFDI